MENKFGTIKWATEVAKIMQNRAQKAISKRKAGLTYMKGLPRSTKFYLALITGAEYQGFKKYNNGPAYKNGYLLMTDAEYRYAVNLLTAEEKNKITKKDNAFLYKGKKMIVAADCNIYGKLTLVPLR